MATRAKFRCDEITLHGNNTRTVKLNAVMADDNSPENRSFSRWTPSGSLQMQISNPDAFGIFEVGRSYYLDISLAVCAHPVGDTFCALDPSHTGDHAP